MAHATSCKGRDVAEKQFLRFNYLNRCKIRDGKIAGEELLLKNIGRMRDVRMGPDGYIYVAVENPGYVFKLVPVKR